MGKKIDKKIINYDFPTRRLPYFYNKPKIFKEAKIGESSIQYDSKVFQADKINNSLVIPGF